VSYFIVVQSDVMIGSAFLSTVAIGHYSVALQLATLPMAKVMGTINQITLPAMSRQQDDPARLRQNLLKSIGIMSLVAFPTLWGISAIAPELVRVLFGEKWLDSVTALTLLPLVVPLRMVSSIFFTAALALGNRQLDLRNTIINFVLLPGGFFIGAHWGLTGLCVSWLISVPLAYALVMPTLIRYLGFRLRDIGTECGAPAIAGGVMYAAVAILRMTLAGQSDLMALVLLSAAGAIVYFAVIALISRRHLVSIGSFARSLMSREAPKTA
jgi:O-antigen/teichoic acid export membrane protein